jgi:hypothetical protein
MNAEFLTPNGYQTTPENQMEAARRNEANAAKLRRIEQLLDAGHPYSEAIAMVEGEQ